MAWKTTDSIRGNKGDKGDPGSIASASAESVDATAGAAVVMTGNDAVKHAHFLVPRGLPGVNAVPTAEAVGTYLAAPDSPSRPGFESGLAVILGEEGSAPLSQLDTRYPVFRLWDAVEEEYPAPIDGALNVFIGPVDPGVLAPAGSRWLRSDAVNVATVAAAVLDPTSPLNTAVQIASRPDSMFIAAADMAAVGTVVPTAASIGGAAPFLSGWLYGTASNGRAQGLIRTPKGWNSARVSVLFSHDVAAPTGAIRWELSLAEIAAGASFKNATPTRFGTGAVGAQYVVSSAALIESGGGVPVNPAGGIARLSITRRVDSAENTFANPVLLIGVTLERMS